MVQHLVMVFVVIGFVARVCGAQALRDSDGNSYPVKQMRDHNLWTTVNLRVNTNDSYCYENRPDNCTKYGRLYTWRAAEDGCRQFGDGWRLPTAPEWQQLAKRSFGSDTTLIAELSFRELTDEQSTFHAVLGGGRSTAGEYGRIGAHGFYWASTGDAQTAWYANFASGAKSLFFQTDGEKGRAFSVRCIKSTR